MSGDIAGRMRPRAARAALLAVLLAAAGGADAADRKALDEIRALLAAGRSEDALAKARLALVAAGDDAELLELASDAAAATKSADLALWFAHAARGAATHAGKDDRARALAAKCDLLEPPELGPKAPVDEAAAAQLETAKLCARKRCFVNAVQILSRLESTPLSARAEAELEKILATKQAVSQLADSKVAAPRTVLDRKVRSKAAKDYPKHATWDTAVKVETPNYTVVTDAGWEVAQSVAGAMEPKWASEGWKAEGASLVAPSSRASLMIFDAGLGDRYRFEATVRPKAEAGENPFAGLIVGAEGEWEVVGLSGDILSIDRVFETWERVASPRGLTLEERKSFRIAVEVRPRLLRLLLNGEIVAEQEFAAGALRGGVGLLVTDSAAEFEDVRLSY